MADWQQSKCVLLLLFSCSVVSDFLWPHGLQHARLPCPSLSPGVCLSSCPLSQWCHPTSSSSSHPLLFLPSVFPSIRVFSNESALCIRWPKCWSFSFNISSSNEYSGLISFRIDYLDLLAVQGEKALAPHSSVLAWRIPGTGEPGGLLSMGSHRVGHDWSNLAVAAAVQGTLKSLLQQQSSKASIFQPSAFFIVQLSHPYMTTGKSIALTRQTVVSKVTSLLFNMLSRFVITFLH